MELAFDDEKPNTFPLPLVGAAPVMVLPFTFKLLRMPHQTCVCAPRLTPEQDTVAPPGWLGMPATEQLPPPGRTYAGAGLVMMRAEALEAMPSTASIPKHTTLFIIDPRGVRRIELEEAVGATLSAIDLLASG